MTPDRSSRAAWVGILICAIVLQFAHFAKAQKSDWDPEVPKDLFSTGNPPERLRAPKCKECADKMAALQAALDDWYAMRLGEVDKILGDSNKPSKKAQESLEKEKGDLLKGLGNPKDGGADAKKQQKKNSDKDLEEVKKKTGKGKKAKDTLKEKIAKAVKDLEDCEKNCPTTEETATPTPTPTPDDGKQPGTGETEKPPDLPKPSTLPTPPPCFETEADRKAFIEKWEKVFSEQNDLARRSRVNANGKQGNKQDPWYIYYSKSAEIYQKSADDLRKIIDDADDKTKTPVPCPKKTTTGGGGPTKPTPTPKGKPKKAPRVTTGGNVSYERPMEDFCTEISDNKIKVDITGTGETIGHIADARISNLTDEAIAFTIPPAVLESHSGKNQNYGIPHTTDVALKPHEAKTIPLDGVCLDRHKPPVGKGIGDDLAFNDCDPDGRIPHDRSDRMLRIAETVYQAADELEEDGKLKEIPYKDPKKRKEIVEQWATWVRISEVTGDPPPTKDDLKKVVEKQVGKVPPDKQKKIDEGIDTIFEKIELTTEKAKDLDKAASEEASPANTGENISNDTPTPPPQTKEKKKDKKDKKGKAKGPPGKWPNPVKDWWLKLVAAEGADYKKQAAQDAYKTKLADYFKQNKHHEELVDKINKAQGKLSNALGGHLTTEQADKLIKERDDAKKELATLESQLEKDFQKTDDGKKAWVEKGDAEKAADDARKAEQEAGKYLDKDAIGDHIEELMKSAKEEAEKEKKIPATW